MRSVYIFLYVFEKCFLSNNLCIIVMYIMEIIRNRYSYSQKNIKRRPTRRFRLLPFSLFMIFLLSISAYSYLAITASPPVFSLESKEFNYSAEKVELIWPSTGSAAVGSLEEGLLMANGTDDIAPIASMSKVITALVVLDKAPLQLGESGEVYTITEADVATYNSYLSMMGSVMPVRAGQNLTQYQLLQGLLLPSGNNAADYLVNWKFGSMEEYIKYASNYLEEGGLKKTTVADASGFSPKTVSSPSDMIKIGQLALKNQVISEIVSQDSANLPDSGLIRNTNLFLQEENVVGLKTGTTDEAGRCLLFAVKHGPDLSEIMIGVVMGQLSMIELYNNVSKLSDSTLSNFTQIEIIPAKSAVANFESEWGQSSNIINNESLSIYGWKGKDYSSANKIDSSKHEIRSGEVVGQTGLAEPGSSIDVVSEDTITKPGILWRLINYPSYW